MSLPLADRLSALRQRLRTDGLDGFLLLRGDEHLGEYVAPYAERLAWLTGFTGSAGLAIVLSDRAAVFADGRYTLQIETQVDGERWERLHLLQDHPDRWLAEAAAVPDREARIGYDPWLMSEEFLGRYARPGIELVTVDANPVDGIWTDRPAVPLAPAVPHPLERAGIASSDKRRQIAALLDEAGEDAVVLSDPASIAWLLNIRGGDIPFTPFALGFAILHRDTTAELFMAPEKLAADTRAWLGNEVSLHAPAALPGALAQLAGRRVRIDPVTTPAWFARTLRAAGATISAAADPIALPKARKNPTEQDGTREAHRRDGAAMCRFLHWLSGNGVGVTELEVVERLNAFRAESPLYRGESFPAISGSGPNGAIVHYRVDEASNRTLGRNEVFLIDSGAQYPDGTTDITRTVWLGDGPAPDEVRDHATRVLKGHIALATIRFPAGVVGMRLDALARMFLWQAGLDYDHGTGHGVGSFLSVHEGPCSIGPAARPVALEPGMVLSNEPGFYRAGAYGIRFENLVLVHATEPVDMPGAKPFLRFEPLTLVPFDRALIEPAMLSAEERRWVDTYHRRVRDTLRPLLTPEVQQWLDAACAPLAN
ncbi:aminopeptidase P family protein [Rhizosaccharibacter radicis]|uniref:Aminopeptidase P family protein n=1 Tax=Rhizosaccharibacter radicis TaxID=2782605 RepID=A0ABT1VWE1_9PROT|nr:aminopeptidase P family protein [Acetobacteraceae bacterium KSS12]